MKKYILTLILLFIYNISDSQTFNKVDTIIKEKNYISFYSFDIKAPVFIIYKLYKGGGNSSRKNMFFKSNLSHFEYKKSGYDIGHLANAEDFAYNKELEELTFRFYNAIPQSPNLNRGIWKKFENIIRKESQKDSLLIICGGLNFRDLIPINCFKIVYSLSTNKVIYFCIIY